MSANRRLAVGAVVGCIAVVAAIFAGIVAPYDPQMVSITNIFSPAPLPARWDLLSPSGRRPIWAGRTVPAPLRHQDISVGSLRCTGSRRRSGHHRRHCIRSPTRLVERAVQPQRPVSSEPGNSGRVAGGLRMVYHDFGCRLRTWPSQLDNCDEPGHVATLHQENQGKSKQSYCFGQSPFARECECLRLDNLWQPPVA